MRRAVLRARRIVVGHIFPELMPELAAFDGTGIVRFAARAFCRLRAVLRARRIAVGDVCHKFMPEFVDGLLLDVVARRAFALPFAVLRAGCGLRYLPFSVIVRMGSATPPRRFAAARTERRQGSRRKKYRRQNCRDLPSHILSFFEYLRSAPAPHGDYIIRWPQTQSFSEKPFHRNENL